MPDSARQNCKFEGQTCSGDIPTVGCAKHIPLGGGPDVLYIKTLPVTPIHFGYIDDNPQFWDLHRMREFFRPMGLVSF